MLTTKISIKVNLVIVRNNLIKQIKVKTIPNLKAFTIVKFL